MCFFAPAPALAYGPGPDPSCVPEAFVTSGELGADEVRAKSDVGLI